MLYEPYFHIIYDWFWCFIWKIHLYHFINDVEGDLPQGTLLIVKQISNQSQIQIFIRCDGISDNLRLGKSKIIYFLYPTFKKWNIKYLKDSYQYIHELCTENFAEQ